MIPIEKLKSVRTIVTHGNCADGVASAMVLKTALYDADVIFVQHGTAYFENLRATEGLLFVDISPPAARVQEFVDAGAIVLDHHRTAKPVVEAFGELGAFADEELEPGVSGAALAWRQAGRLPARDHNHSFVVADLAELAGIRDTWQTKSPRWREACAQAAALRFYPADHLIGLAVREWRTALRIGETLLAKNHERVVQAVAESHRFKVGSLRVVTFCGLDTSDVAESIGSDADLIVGFSYRVDAGDQKIQLSFRSRGDFDCSALAKWLGGGGHTKAAGSAVKIGPQALNPYSDIEGMLWLHLGNIRPSRWLEGSA